MKYSADNLKAKLLTFASKFNSKDLMVSAEVVSIACATFEAAHLCGRLEIAGPASPAGTFGSNHVWSASQSLIPLSPARCLLSQSRIK